MTKRKQDSARPLAAGPAAAKGPAVEVSAELVQAALRAADRLGCRVADVSVTKIAREVGISRSTLLRRLGGSRAALDDAVRAAGIDPGGLPVKVRALAAAAEVISESGVGLTTLDAIALRADCSVDSLFAIFGSRDELLAAVFERYSPLPDIGDVLAAASTDLGSTVRHVYGRFATALTQQPRVTPALIAEALSRPTSPAVRSVVRHNGPRMLAVIGDWLADEVAAGRIRDLPLPLLINQFVGPLAAHLLLRPAAIDADLVEMPSIEQTLDIFAEAFVQAVAVDPVRPRTTDRDRRARQSLPGEPPS